MSGTIKALDPTRRVTLGDLKGIKSQQESLMFTAAFLLKPGGSMVYSTCTFNPLENEVVVAEYKSFLWK